MSDRPTYPPLTANINTTGGRAFSEDMLIRAFDAWNKPRPRCGSPESPHWFNNSQIAAEHSPYANCLNCGEMVRVRELRPGEARKLYRGILEMTRGSLKARLRLKRMRARRGLPNED